MVLITESSPRISQPKGFKVKLMKHQLAMAKACLDFEQNSTRIIDDHTFEFKFGLICDKVGAGKSYVSLSIISSILSPPNESKTYASSSMRDLYVKTRMLKENDTKNYSVKTNMIIVPHTTMSQWINYTKDTELECFYLDSKKNEELFAKMNREDLGKYDVLLVSGSRIKSLNCFNNFEKINFKRIFIDEADSIRTKVDYDYSYSKSSDFVWFISSSIENLRYVSSHYVYNEELGYSVLKGGITSNLSIVKKTFNDFDKNIDCHNLFSFNCDMSFIDQSICIPPLKLEEILCKNPKLLSILNDLISKKTVEKINAGDIKGAIATFDCEKAETEEDLVKVVCDDLERQLYALRTNIEAKKLQYYVNENLKEAQIKRMEMGIVATKEKLANIKEKLKDAECSICYDNIENDAIVKCCNTKFCFECIATWLKDNTHKHSCPFCRATISKTDLLVLGEKNKIPKCNDTYKDKFVEFNALIDKIFNQSQSEVAVEANDSRKVLVFSDHISIFTKMINEFKSRNLKFKELKGASKTIANRIELFSKGEIQILMLNTKYCGAGLNLQCATDVIIYHKLSNDLEKQVIGRANRFGRKTPLNVWKLLNLNEK